jgi:hypothetical protein
MCAMAKKYDDEILAKMNEGKPPAAGGTSGSGGTKKKGGVLGSLGKLLKSTSVKTVLKAVAGPVLAAGATAVGLPQLAPVLLKLGPQLADAAVTVGKEVDQGWTGVASGGGASGSGASPGSSAAQGSAGNEQVRMMELQRLQNKQQEMFATISNILKTTHDTRMGIIQNLRG